MPNAEDNFLQFVGGFFIFVIVIALIVSGVMGCVDSGLKTEQIKEMQVKAVTLKHATWETTIDGKTKFQWITNSIPTANQNITANN